MLRMNELSIAEFMEISCLDDVISFFRKYLDWPDQFDSVVEACYEYDPDELGLTLAQAASITSIRQLRPISAIQRWGIFLVSFDRKNISIGILRRILRSLVTAKSNRASSASAPTWKLEDLLFLCSHQQDDHEVFSFVHFSQPKEAGHVARLSSFSWIRGTYSRTVLEFNLPPLRWPSEVTTVSDWHDQWLFAFDKKRLTELFYREYRALFMILQSDLCKQTDDLEWSHDYALQILSRCMFLCFIQRKRWLGGDSEFLRNLWDVYQSTKRNENIFYEEWLSVLFFEAFNNNYKDNSSGLPRDIEIALRNAPYLNGGLFREGELDRKYSVVVSDQRILQILTFLERYNFTVSEDTPLEQEVAVDAEMLGRVYESLVNLSEEASDRVDAGIFYTPRTEIDLMCRLSLVDNMANHLGEEYRELLYIVLFALTPEDKRAADTHMEEKNLWNELDIYLNKLTVVDPACGSGSFLVGMLQVLDDLAERTNRVLGRQETTYERRKRIIGQSLYGVDVMRWAVEVAELRLWLQLVIETELEPAELKFRPLLPNLSFKVRCGDSLVQEIGSVSFKHSRNVDDIPQHLKGRLTRLKGEKLNYYYNRDTMPDTANVLLQEENSIYHDIISARIDSIAQHYEQYSAILKSKYKDIFGVDRLVIEGEERREAEIEQKHREARLTELRHALEALESSSTPPFIWDVAFVEIFTSDRNGFDIVIGNPPYVRAQRISNPAIPREITSARNKKEYKSKLATSVYREYPSFFRFNPVSGKASHKIDAKSDLYMYFYFHGLSLLNKEGSFSYITSNSWLDAGYGSILQEFLLHNCHIKMIIDNLTHRSFNTADVNTVIVLISAPSEVKDWGLSKTARFIMIKSTFETMLSSGMFADIEKATQIEVSHCFRVFPILQQRLLEDGLERSSAIHSTKHGVSSGAAASSQLRMDRYGGNKWGGKYLRAPDILLNILNNHSSSLVKLGDIASVSTYLNTGGADKFFFLEFLKSSDGVAQVQSRSNRSVWSIEEKYLKVFLESPRQLKSRTVIRDSLATRILVVPPEEELEGTLVAKYIAHGEAKGYHKASGRRNTRPWYRPPANSYSGASILWPCRFGDKFYVCWNPEELVSHRFYRIDGIDDDVELESLWGLLNCTLTWLLAELYAGSSLGAGVLDMNGDTISSIPILKPCMLIDNSLHTTIKALQQEPFGNTATQLSSTHLRELDTAVFEHLGLTSGEREAVYEAVARLVETRAAKAGSVRANVYRDRLDAVQKTVGIWSEYSNTVEE